MLLPLVPLIVAGLIATANNCMLDEGDAHPCIVFGTDVGDTLYTMQVMGFIAIVTVPTGLVALLVFSVFVAWHNRRAVRP